MRKRRFLTQKAAFCKEENAALFSAYQRRTLFDVFLRKRFSQKCTRKGDFGYILPLICTRKGDFGYILPLICTRKGDFGYILPLICTRKGDFGYILQVFCGFERSCMVVVLRVLRERFEDKMKIIS